MDMGWNESSWVLNWLYFWRMYGTLLTPPATDTIRQCVEGEPNRGRALGPNVQTATFVPAGRVLCNHVGSSLVGLDRRDR